jgi:hypothetical protein
MRVAAGSGPPYERRSGRAGPAEGRSSGRRRAEGSGPRAVVGGPRASRGRWEGISDALGRSGSRRGGSRRRRRGGVLGSRRAGRRSSLVRWRASRRTSPRRRALERRRPLEARRRPGERVCRVGSEVLRFRAGRRSLPGRGGVLQGDWQRDGGRYAAAKAFAGFAAGLFWSGSNGNRVN